MNNYNVKYCHNPKQKNHCFKNPDVKAAEKE